MIVRVIAFVFGVAVLSSTVGRAQIIQENKGPSETQITEFVKSKLPPYFNFQCLKITSSEVTEKKAAFRCLLTISPTQRLFLGATAEVIPELEEMTELPAGVTPPAILKKARGAREVLEVPVEVTFHWLKEQWEGIVFEDRQQLASFGMPREEFKLNAVVFGTTEAKSAISQFRKDLAKAEAARKKTESGAKK